MMNSIDIAHEMRHHASIYRELAAQNPDDQAALVATAETTEAIANELLKPREYTIGIRKGRIVGLNLSAWAEDIAVVHVRAHCTVEIQCGDEIRVLSEYQALHNNANVLTALEFIQ